MKLVALILVVLGVLSTAVSGDEPDYLFVAGKINPVMNPNSLIDQFLGCSGDNECNALIDNAIKQFGVPDGSTSGIATAVIEKALDGEEGRYAVRLPPGYQYCHSQIAVVSVAPASGDRAPAFGVFSRQFGLSAYTWTGRQGLGGGKSWIEAHVTIEGVRNDLANASRVAGICRPFDQKLLDCRGATAGSHGVPACKSTSD